MAKYTVELRTLMNDDLVRPLLNEALSKYPMYKPLTNNEEVLAIIPTRQTLNDKLLNHYKYREIGFETVGRFLDELEITMNEIMPYYNQMFNTVEIMANLDNPFDNVDVIEQTTEKRSGTSKTNDVSKNTSKSNDESDTTASASDQSNTTSNVTSFSKNVESETPQGQLDIPGENIDGVDYADKASWNKNKSDNTANTSGSSSSTAKTTSKGDAETNSESESESETSDNMELTYTKKGNQGVNTYAHDMIEFRTSIIDVVTQIIDDKRIKNLFMQIF